MRSTPSTFVWTTVASTSSVDSPNGTRPRASPALLKRMSIPPSASTAASTKARLEPSSITSSGSATIGVHALDAARAARDADARLAQLPHRRGADPRGRSRDDGRLPCQIHDGGI